MATENAETQAVDVRDCGCDYEDVDWNGIPVRRWFHEPGCGSTPEEQWDRLQAAAASREGNQ